MIILENQIETFSTKTVIEIKLVGEGVIYKGLARDLTNKNEKFYKLMMAEVIKISHHKEFIGVVLCENS